MKIVAIIQARTGSTRLPGKILKDLCGIPVIVHMIRRVKECKYVQQVVIATTEKKQDDIIEDISKSEGVEVFRGSEEDVLDRYYNAAKSVSADIIVRVTSDDPLIDFNIIDKVINNILDEKSDYSCNNMIRTYPLGLDCECFTFKALEKAWLNAKSSREREHVTPYIRENRDIFKISTLNSDKDYSYLRWTLDTIDDYHYINNIYENLYKHNEFFKTDDIIAFLEKNKIDKE
ncbi:glycosyltransferase family protein [Clostridium sporogenes]|uniref:Glycosyltransferase family protein n=1 Tax=Clostridium sporogenes TaxID=1509 RepID=A0AAE4FIJ6_CLOSG|nr:glycosyltransferase family protein [Clostridium sporogenes]MDS1002891.1 glycosyltransferase family protein [Clostridium sporogenes]